MTELNPNHPVTRMTHDQWHKIVGILMLKMNLTEMEITLDDLVLLGNDAKAVVADCRGGKFVVRVMEMADAVKLARKEGGLPV